MTLLYENRRRAKRARVSTLTAWIWTIGCFYWAYVLHSGGSRQGIVAMVVIVGLLPVVALHFYSDAYVVRIARNGDEVVITTLGLFGNREVRVPVNAVAEVQRPEAGGMTLRVAGRQMPFILDLQAEHCDLNAIAALANRDANGKP